MSGDNFLYDPGQRVSVEVVADASGEVAGRGQLVEIVGQTRDSVQVALSSGDGIAHLARVPDDYDEDEDYAEGDSAGDGMVYLRNPVDWFETADLSALAPGDLVVDAGDGGVAAYDEAGGDTPDMVLGRVWTTGSHAEGTASKVAVHRHR